MIRTKKILIFKGTNPNTVNFHISDVCLFCENKAEFVSFKNRISIQHCSAHLNSAKKLIKINSASRKETKVVDDPNIL